MKLTLINKNNEVLDLLNSRDKFILSGAEGLHGIDTEIGETDTPYADGTTAESVKALPRGIELTLTLRGDIQRSIDYITSIVKSKQYVTLREINGERDITVKGIVTIPPYSRMQPLCKITISVYCPQPYWEDINQLVETISEFIDKLCFPQDGQYFTEVGRPFGVIYTDLTKSVVNEGDTDVGMLISIVARGEVVKPRISCSTGNQNGWYMMLNLTLKTDDEVIISTVKNDKYITINGLETYNGEPIINALQWYGKDWLQLETGENIFSVTTESAATNSNVYFGLIYKGRYA